MKIDDTVFDIIAGGFDAGLRLGELLNQDMVAVRLVPICGRSPWLRPTTSRTTAATFIG